MKRLISLLTAFVLIGAMLSGCAWFEKPVQALSLDKTELALTVGDSAALNAGDAAKLRWTSDNEDVAVVHAGTVTARSAGKATVTVTSEDGGSASCAVTVSDKLITSISLSASSIRLGLGKTIQLNASYSPADASDHALSWLSEDEDIACVNDEGYVTGMSAGVTEIICRSSSGIEAVCTVTVVEAVEQPTNVPAAVPTAKPTEKPTEANKPTEAGSNTPAPAVSGDFIFPDSSARILSEEEVKATLGGMTGTPLSGSFSQDAVNEIFARNGYVFRTASIRAYYESKAWYRADPNFDSADLSEVEQYNIALFSKY